MQETKKEKRERKTESERQRGGIRVEEVDRIGQERGLDN